MKELLIPYGLHTKSNAIIEPEDAVRGRACDCNCPGCGAPLLSRHPANPEVRIHFAHDSKHPLAKPIDECPLSPFVALAMMARHLAPALVGRTIWLGALNQSVYFECCATSTMAQIQPACTALIESSVQSFAIDGMTYDLALTIGGKLFLVDISYPGRWEKPLPSRFHLPDVGGIFILSGIEFLNMMSAPGVRKNRYSDAVVEFILDHSTKRWQYHANTVHKLFHERTDHRCAAPDQTKQQGTTYSVGPLSARHQPSGHEQAPSHPDARRTVLTIHPKSAPPVAAVTDRYECLFCQIEFDAARGSPPKCTRCGKHLGARKL